MSTEQPGPGSGSRLQFLDLSEVTAPDTRAQLQHVLLPPAGGGPLPGTRGTVWRTPRNSSPEFEFGDGEITDYLTRIIIHSIGVSAVFKSLSVSSPPAAPSNSRHVLSANTAPFVPSVQVKSYIFLFLKS